MTGQETTYLIVSLMKGTAKYMVLHISDGSTRLIYKNAMKQCIYIMQEYPSIERCRAEIKCSINNIKLAYPNKWWKSNAKMREYHLLAFAQTLEIISSIEKRFILGSSCDPNIQSHKVIDIYYNNVDFE